MKALLFTLGLASLHALSAHAGVDPACAPVIKSSLARAAAPAWEAVTVVSPGNFKMEAIQFGGQSFMRMNGERWKKAPMDLAKGEQQVVAQINSGQIKLSKCKDGGDSTIDGIPWTQHWLCGRNWRRVNRLSRVKVSGWALTGCVWHEMRM